MVSFNLKLGDPVILFRYHFNFHNGPLKFPFILYMEKTQLKKVLLSAGFIFHDVYLPLYNGEGHNGILGMIIRNLSKKTG